MRSVGRLPLVLGAAREVIAHMDALDHEHLVLQHDDAFGIRGQPTLARVDPARLQRANKGSRESTGGRGHHVVERGGMVGILPRGGAVVLPDLIVRPEHDRFGFRREVSLADWPVLADDPDLRDVLRLIHADQISAERHRGVTRVRLMPPWTRFRLPSRQVRSRPTGSFGGTASSGYRWGPDTANRLRGHGPCSSRRRGSLPFQRSSGGSRRWSFTTTMPCCALSTPRATRSRPGPPRTPRANSRPGPPVLRATSR